MFAVVIMAGACLGYGAMILRLIGVERTLDPVEHPAWAAVLGMGMLGWLAFFPGIAGYLGTPALYALCGLGLPGLIFLRPGGSLPRLGILETAVLAMLAAVMILDIFEGLAPPADADSLAYHFALPKRFLDAGHIVFVPMAIEGAIPLLQQMTYAVALGIGGESALTLWTAISGWTGTMMVFVIARRHLPPSWALAATLLFMTTPAVIYGAGSGQVEVRNAAFVLLAVAATARAIREDDLRFTVLAGLAASFFIGSKYPGLLLAFACGLVLLGQRRWLAHGTVFSLIALAAGSQWYAWNWWNTGDPVFPMLFGIIDYNEGVPWNSAQDAFFRTIMAKAEIIVPQNLLWFLLYPLKATLWSAPKFEALRAGFGPVVLMLLPPALAGWAARRSAHIRGDIPVFLLTALIVYALWFFLGPSQRMRHLLPIYPLLLISAMVGAQRAAQTVAGFRAPTVTALSLGLLIQLNAAGLFSLQYVTHVLSGESREAFLERNTTGADVAAWINTHLDDEDRIFVTYRERIYLIDRPVFYGHSLYQAEIETRFDDRDVFRFWNQLLAQDIAWILASPPNAGEQPTGGLGYFTRVLLDHGCLSEEHRFTTIRRTSRTLPDMVAHGDEEALYALTPRTCRLETPEDLHSNPSS